MIYDFQRFLSIRLIVWAILSILVGTWLWISGIPFWRGFGLQMAGWGAVDAAIALFGLCGLASKLTAPLDLAQAAGRTRWLRRILFANTGLDIFYIAGGLALALTLGRSQHFQASMGWGIVLQGAFLLLFDSLHAWRIPTEIILPAWGLFQGPQHAAFERSAGRPAALFIHGFPDTPFAMSDLAECLHDQGWTVSGLLLPGFGPQLETLYQQRVEFWIDAVCQEIVRLKKEHSPVLLVGFSLGGGLAIPAAVRSRPDGLALLAPFSLPHSDWLNAVYPLARIFTPFSIGVCPFIDLDSAEIQQGFAKLIPEFSLADPVVRDAVQQLRVPLLFLEQFLRLSRLAYHSAPLWHGPTLVIQGADDTIIRPSWTRRLVDCLGSHPRLYAVPGNHNLNLAGHVSFPEITSHLAQFARSIREK
jgi:esterase/lipase